jgi:DNA repair protein RadD
MPRKINTTLSLFDEEIKPVSVLTPRPYQEKAVRLIVMHKQQGKKRILCVAPTRAGKMVIIAMLARMTKLPVMFVAHRMELIDQCVSQLERVGLSNVGVLRGDDPRENPHASIQVCSIATLARREKPFAGQRILIFIDEAHRSCSESYVTHIFEAYPDAIIVGFTATPCRLDNKPLGNLYEVLEVVATYTELLKHPDWLVEPDIFASPIRADLSRVGMIGGDFDEGALAEVMHQDVLEGNIVDHWLKLAHRHPVFTDAGDRAPTQFVDRERRRTFLFATSIVHSQSICARFEKAGIKIAHIDGTTPEEQRRAALRDLASGALEIVSNVNVLLEGVDLPEAKCCVHARPTHSLTLWRQSSCRILTPYKGIIPLLLDHASNFDRLGAPHEDLSWSLTSRAVRRSTAPAMKVCHQCYAYVLAGKVVCPHCGYAFPNGGAVPKPPEETNAELQQRNLQPDILKQEFFNKMLQQARLRGFKPGFASARYKEHYGKWPPAEWSELAKWEFAKDIGWQTVLAARESRKKSEQDASDREVREAVEKIQRVNALSESLHDELVESNVEPVDDDDSFNAWVRHQGIQ